MLARRGVWGLGSEYVNFAYLARVLAFGERNAIADCFFDAALFILAVRIRIPKRTWMARNSERASVSYFPFPFIFISIDNAEICNLFQNKSGLSLACTQVNG